MARGHWRVVAVSVIAVAALPVVSGCDDFRDVEVTNACAKAIDIANSQRDAGYGIITVEPGEKATANSSGGPFDVVVRDHDAEKWDVTIRWDEMSTGDDEYLRTVTVEGDTCPGQQN